MELGPQPFDMMVGFSQFDAGRAMTEHLLSAGYRRIAFLAARLDPRSNRRMAGYSAVMAEAGLADESLMVQTKAPSSVQGGDRKSGVEGKSVSVRVDLGGRRSIKKKTTNK